MEILIKALQLLLSLSLLVVLHEFGHYFAARYFKIRVEMFYLFFNPWFALFKKKIGDTEWGIGWLPLGGFVKISGMIDESMDKEQLAQPIQPWEFRAKPAWQRLIVMIAGVVVNLIFGVLIYIGVVFAWGEEQIHTADLKDGLTVHPFMQQYGIESGDNILAIDNVEVTHIGDITSGLVIRGQQNLKVQKASGDIENILLPDSIDYAIFEAGAFPTVELRHQSTKVEFLRALKTNDTIKVEAGDVFLTINDKPLDQVNFNNLEKKFNLTLIRGNDTLVQKIASANFNLLKEVSPALSAGILPGDNFKKINNEEIIYFDDITDELFHAKETETVLSVQRNGTTQELQVEVPKSGSLGFTVRTVGYVDSAAFRHVDYSLGQSFGRGFDRGVTTLGDYVGQLKFLFTKKGASSIGGFAAIGNLFPAEWNWEKFWLNTAFISIILAFMNILPIPALDGGHVVFLLYEMVTGKEAPQKVLEYAQMVGFFILMGLLLYANGNDVYRMIFG